MTEFDAAFAFVRAYADAIAVTARRHERLDDRAAYWRFCEEHGLTPTPERLLLARDVAVAARELVAGRAGGRSAVVDAGADRAETLGKAPPMLAYALECHGWRADFLRREVRPTLGGPTGRC